MKTQHLNWDSLGETWDELRALENAGTKEITLNVKELERAVWELILEFDELNSVEKDLNSEIAKLKGGE